MKELFQGLEGLGFENIEEMEVFKPVASSDEGEVSITITANAISYDECIYDKNYTCPVCEKRFKEKTIKLSRVKFIEVDVDLMPRYTPLQPFYYNVIICPGCGYSALSENFLKISERQAELIKSQITPKYKKKDYELPFTEDAVIERYKFALLNTIVKRGKVSERAYICLVISWLYKVKEDEENRRLFVKNAYDAFVDAYGKDSFPFFGMNEVVTSYLIAVLADHLGEYDDATRWISRVLGSRLATQKVKDMAIDLKTKIAKRNLQGAKVKAEASE